MHRSTNESTTHTPFQPAWRGVCRALVALVLCVEVFATIGPAMAQPLTPETVLAHVGDDPISLGDVIQMLRNQFPGREIPSDALARMSTQMLDAIVRERLIQLHLAETDIEVEEAEVSEAVGSIKGQIAEVGATYEQFLKERGLTDATLKEQVASDLRWQEFLTGRLTDEVVQTHFEEHKSEFDGSEKRLGHIMVRPVGSVIGGQQAAAEKAKLVRQQIVDGTIDFAEAARRHSDAPSRREGGDLGYMKRDAPWNAHFMEAAFALGEDELSDVVTTDNGVHLILCKKIRRGYQTFNNVRDQVYQAARSDLRTTIVDEERARTPVTFTGVIAHVDLETGETVAPAAASPAAAAAGDTP